MKKMYTAVTTTVAETFDAVTAGAVATRYMMESAEIKAYHFRNEVMLEGEYQQAETLKRYNLTEMPVYKRVRVEEEARS